MNKYSLCFLVLFFFADKLFAQSEFVPYRVFVELKAGLHSEKNLLTDPGGRLNHRSKTSPTTGINAGVYLNDGRSALTLELDIVTIGNSFFFDSVSSFYGAGIGFKRITTSYNYNLPLITNKGYTKLSLFGKIGPSITFKSRPKGSTGLVATVFYDNNDDTTAFIISHNTQNRNVFASLTLGAGLLITPNPRLRFSYSIYPSWNFTSNDVITQDIKYRFFNDPTIYQASALSTGTTLTHSLAIGYAFGKTQLRKEQIEKKKELYTAEEWEKRKRWSLLLHTSNSYPVIKLNDPAGHLTSKPVERFTFGAQVFYRLKPKWQVATGFESVPFQLDARTPTQIGGNGTYVRNSLQFPLLAEYRLLQTKGKIKVEWLASGGMAIGLQRKAIADPDMDFDLRLIQQPEYYWEKETRDRPSKAFFAALIGTRVNINLSKTIFLSGYANYQQALTKNTFHRSRARYQINNPQAPFFNAELTTRGSNFLPGFGVGFRL
jgi:hypothetical protein